MHTPHGGESTAGERRSASVAPSCCIALVAMASRVSADTEQLDCVCCRSSGESELVEPRAAAIAADKAAAASADKAAQHKAAVAATITTDAGALG